MVSKETNRNTDAILGVRFLNQDEPPTFELVTFAAAHC